MANEPLITPWKDYVEKTKGRNARPFLVKAISYIPHRDECLDLGAGALNDAKYLLEEGFKHVTAVDKEPVAQEIATALPSAHFRYVISSFEEFQFPENKYDLINAQFSLPFGRKENFDIVFEKIKRSLVTGGIFTGQFLGDRDEWNTSSSAMTFHKKEGVKQLLSDMQIIELIEEEKDQPTVIQPKPKHWHIFHIIAKKN